MINVISVPHTGTRYLCKFLDHLGVAKRPWHTEPGSFEDLVYLEGKAVIPMRDPAFQYTSTLFGNNLANKGKILEFCVECWEILGQVESQFEREYLRLDGDSQTELERVAAFVGAEIKTPFTSGPVGSQLSSPIGEAQWERHKDPIAEAALRPYRERYGYLSNSSS